MVSISALVQYKKIELCPPTSSSLIRSHWPTRDFHWRLIIHILVTFRPFRTSHYLFGTLDLLSRISAIRLAVPSSLHLCQKLGCLASFSLSLTLNHLSHLDFPESPLPPILCLVSLGTIPSPYLVLESSSHAPHCTALVHPVCQT